MPVIQDMLPGVEIFSQRSRVVAGRRRRAARVSDRARVMQQMFSAESARRGRWTLPDLDPTNPTSVVIPWWTDRALRPGEVRGERPVSTPSKGARSQSSAVPRITGVKRSALLAARSRRD